MHIYMCIKLLHTYLLILSNCYSLLCYFMLCAFVTYSIKCCYCYCYMSCPPFLSASQQLRSSLSCMLYDMYSSDENKVICIAKCDTFSSLCKSISQVRLVSALVCESLFAVCMDQSVTGIHDFTVLNAIKLT